MKPHGLPCDTGDARPRRAAGSLESEGVTHHDVPRKSRWTSVSNRATKNGQKTDKLRSAQLSGRIRENVDAESHNQGNNAKESIMWPDPFWLFWWF